MGKYDKVFKKIITDIKEGKLKVGDKIPAERVLASELAISRNTVRESLNVLEKMGVIESKRGSGNYVSANMIGAVSTLVEMMLDLNQFSKSEFFKFRMHIDKMVCEMLLEQPENIDALADRAEALLCEPTHTSEEEHEQDKKFHLLLVEATGNKLINLLMKSVAKVFGDMIDAVRDVSDVDLNAKLLAAHKNIVLALRGRNKEKCDRAVEYHYAVADEIVKKGQLKEYQDTRVYSKIGVQDDNQERDALTGLYDKNVFFSKADEYIAAHKDENLILWASDVNGLRFINEKYGMETGDKVLAAVASHGTEAKGFLFGGRIGGDKFCALIKTDAIDCQLLNKILKEAFETMFPVPNLVVKNGIYRIKNDETLSAHAMYVRAVLALQSIKNSYNTVIVEYNDSMRKELLDSKQIEADAKDSLARGEFSIYFQPKIDLSQNTVAGAEALIRWIHPELGFLSPGMFIPIFERNGFIKSLDFWVWEETCKVLSAWKESGRPMIPISVNVSRNSFEDETLADKIIDLVDRYNLEHSLLEIEITEYSCLDNMEIIRDTIKKLHDAGFTISLDDFGTGFSSMVVLSKIEIDIMKLDMSLIRNDDKNDKRSALEFALQLAEMMQLKTVAEGIETETQVERIRSLGADYIQGYYYSKPLPRLEFENYVSNNSANIAR